MNGVFIPVDRVKLWIFCFIVGRVYIPIFICDVPYYMISCEMLTLINQFLTTEFVLSFLTAYLEIGAHQYKYEVKWANCFIINMLDDGTKVAPFHAEVWGTLRTKWMFEILPQKWYQCKLSVPSAIRWAWCQFASSRFLIWACCLFLCWPKLLASKQ